MICSWIWYCYFSQEGVLGFQVFPEQRLKFQSVLHTTCSTDTSHIILLWWIYFFVVVLEFDGLCPRLIHFHYNKKNGHGIKKECSIAAVGNLMVRGRTVCQICVLTEVKIVFIVPNLIKQTEWLWGMTTSKCLSVCKFKGLYLN